MLSNGWQVSNVDIKLNEVVGNGSWNLKLLHQLGGTRLVEFSRGYAPRLKKDPEYIWRPAHTGNFSTSSAWDMLHHAQVSNIPFKTFWNPIVTVKILVFIWRLWDNAVAVDEV